MKKFFFLVSLILALSLSVSNAGAQGSQESFCRPSGLLSASGTVSARPGTLCGVIIITSSTNNATVTLYDNATTNSGTVVFEAVLVAGTASYSSGYAFTKPVLVGNGIYATVSGTGANFIVYFSP